jgi:hypothetical protein
MALNKKKDARFSVQILPISKMANGCDFPETSLNPELSFEELNFIRSSYN